jgi:hypothetical protein
VVLKKLVYIPTLPKLLLILFFKGAKTTPVEVQDDFDGPPVPDSTTQANRDDAKEMLKQAK